MIRRIVALVCALTALGLAVMGFAMAGAMARRWAGSAAMTIDRLTAAELATLSAIYPDTPWTAYVQSPAQPLSNWALNGRKASAQALRYLGAPQAIASFPMVAGRLPMKGETGAVALDQATALSLFGAADAQGRAVVIDGQVAQVVGVFEADRPLVVLCASPGDGMERLVAADREQLGQLANAIGGTIDPFELSGGEWAGLARCLCALPLALATLWGAGALRRRGGAWRKAGSLVVMLVLLGGALALIQAVPVRLMPARWSDFAFYERQIAAFKARPYRAPDARDAYLGWEWARVALMSGASLLALWIGRRCVRCEKSRA